jgi:hypothetical protein
MGAHNLRLQADGGIVALGNQGEEIGVVLAPWASDALGRKVPTRYQVNGNILTQIVEHRDAGFEYGVTADPFWIPAGLIIARCMTNAFCREIVVKKGVPAAIAWAAKHLF